MKSRAIAETNKQREQVNHTAILPRAGQCSKDFRGVSGAVDSRVAHN